MIEALLNYHIPVFRGHDVWKTLVMDKDFTEENYPRYKGFAFRCAVKPYKKGPYMNETDRTEEIPDKNLIHMRRIMDMCRERGAELILLAVPSPANYTYERHNAIVEFAGEHGLKYIDLNTCSDEIGINWSTDFLDRGDHLNLSGAERVTEYLGRFLSDHFRLADHRADAAYDGWEKESREYEKKASEGLSKIRKGEEDIREGVRLLLESEEFSVIEAKNGAEGLELIRPDTALIILDIMMPGMNGLRTCEEIRKISNVPVLFLTAKARESDKLIGLMAGGDDYLAKPFSYAELLGRVKALIRRYTVYMGSAFIPEEETEDYLELAGIRINRTYNEVFVEGEEKQLSNIEYQILLLMMQHKGKIFSAQNLYESIWKEPYFYSCNSTVMVHIRNLRTKIERDPKNPKYIKTLWGKGYRFEAPHS